MDVATKQRAYSLIIIIQKKQIDITVGRAVWKSIGQALASEFGPEEGLRLFHLVSKWHPDYDPTECDAMFDWCIKNHDDVDIATFFYHCQKYGVTESYSQISASFVIFITCVDYTQNIICRPSPNNTLPSVVES